MMGKSRLPPGFRFSPTDIELVKYYLERKVMGKRLHGEFIAELDIYKYSPWDLPDKSCWQSGDLKWYFFCPTAKKYSSGCRKNRITECGHWKATGKDRSVLYNGDVVGWIKTLVFHTGRAPKGDRTDWVMHEYRLETKNLADLDVLQDPYVLCMIFQKDGPGPKNGAQYGVPFKEEEWSDDEAEICLEAVPRENMPGPELELPSNYRSSITTSTDSLSGVRLRPSSESCLSDVVAPFCKVLQPVSSNHVTMGKQHVPNDDIMSMFDCFVEESASFIEENDKNEVPGNATHSGNASASFHFKGDDIYGGLGDLGNMARVSEDGDGISNLHNSICASDQMMPGDNGQFLELGDLDEPLMGETPFRFEDHLNMYDKVNF